MGEVEVVSSCGTSVLTVFVFESQPFLPCSQEGVDDEYVGALVIVGEAGFME